MKIITGAFAIIMILAASINAFCGILMEEQQVIDRGNGTPVTHTRKVMIQGNRQKSVGESGDEMVTDLDSGTMMVVNPAKKSYVQMPFPPRGMPPLGAMSNPLTFKKTGTTSKIAGYSCDEYTGSTVVGGNQYMFKGCFSKSAPGVSDFTAFQKTMVEKAKGTPMAIMANFPSGIPLELDSTTKITHINLPGMSAEQTAKVNEMLAKRPPIVTRTTVTKVASQKFSDDIFKPPAGYTKQQPGRMLGPGMHPGAAPAPNPSSGASSGSAPAPTKVPE